MNRWIFIAFLTALTAFRIVGATMLEFTAAVAADFPTYKTLPGLSNGLGWSFGVGIMPFERGGIALGVNSTWHKFDADTGRTHFIRGDSHRMGVFIQGQYRFLKVGDYHFHAYLAAVYNSINGGDESGAYLEYGVNSEDVGYSGYGTLLGIGVSRRFSENYSLNMCGKYNIVNYSKHQYPFFIDTEYAKSRAGSSLLISFGILYQIDFAGF
jgi:hypothetical protein